MQKRLALLMVLLLLIIGMTLVWMLNAMNVLHGPWSALLNAVFTVLSVVLSLLQWHAQVFPAEFMPEAPLSLRERSKLCHDREGAGGSIELKTRKGMIIVYASKKLCGRAIYLTLGFDTKAERIHAAANVVRRREARQVVFTAIFPAVRPGNYTVSAPSHSLRTHVTVVSGHTTEVDWRSFAGGPATIIVADLDQDSQPGSPEKELG
jgi:hypothetical protein